jgi:hypothetical protein
VGPFNDARAEYHTPEIEALTANYPISVKLGGRVKKELATEEDQHRGNGGL